MLDIVEAKIVQQFLDAMPAALALLDKDNRIQWVNDSFVRITGVDRTDVIGKQKSDLSEEAQQLFSDSHVHLDANNQRDDFWLACMNVSLGNYSLQYCSDVTQLQDLMNERESLMTKVAELNPVDETTGMPNRKALTQNLEQQTSRSRRYGNALSIMIMSIENLRDFIRQFGNDNADKLLLSVGQTLNDQMRWADVIGRMDDHEFLFIMPETEETAASELREKVREQLSRLALPGVEDGGFVLNIKFGMAQWRKGDDVGMLMERTQASLAEDKGDKLAV